MPRSLTRERKAAAPIYANLTVRVDLGRPDLAGELLSEGLPISAFTAWVGLLTVFD